MYTTAIAYAAAVSCYIDIIFLLPICRNFVALLRYTSLNHVIPSEKDCTSHDARLVLFTGQGTWSILPNFRWPTLIPRPLAPSLSSLNTNFATGPGITDWIMTAALSIMVFFALEMERL